MRISHSVEPPTRYDLIIYDLQMADKSQSHAMHGERKDTNLPPDTTLWINEDIFGLFLFFGSYCPNIYINLTLGILHGWCFKLRLSNPESFPNMAEYGTLAWRRYLYILF